MLLLRPLHVFEFPGQILMRRQIFAQADERSNDQDVQRNRSFAC